MIKYSELDAYEREHYDSSPRCNRVLSVNQFIWSVSQIANEPLFKMSHAKKIQIQIPFVEEFILAEFPTLPDEIQIVNDYISAGVYDNSVLIGLLSKYPDSDLLHVIKVTKWINK